MSIRYAAESRERVDADEEHDKDDGSAVIRPAMAGPVPGEAGRSEVYV